MSDFVYFIRPTGMLGPIKIGFSLDPAVRVVEVERFSPLRLEVAAIIPGDVALERRIQNCFADCHSHAEWFFPDARLLRTIDAINAGTPIGEAVDLDAPTGNVLGMVIAATMKRNGTVRWNSIGTHAHPHKPSESPDLRVVS